MKTFQISTLLAFPLQKVQKSFFSFWSLIFTEHFIWVIFVLEYQPPPFSEKFFLVVIEKDANRNSVLQMWHLHLRSVQACVGAYGVGYLWNDDTAVSRQLMRGNCEGSLINGELILPLMTNFLFRDGNCLQWNDTLVYPLDINNVHLYCVTYCINSFLFICMSLIFTFHSYLKCILYIMWFENWCFYWLL